jgi:hypothetical protein
MILKLFERFLKNAILPIFHFLICLWKVLVSLQKFKQIIFDSFLRLVTSYDMFRILRVPSIKILNFEGPSQSLQYEKRVPRLGHK